MAEASNDPQSIFEPANESGSRLKGSAEDLSALFGDVGAADPRATHLGRRDTPTEVDVAELIGRLARKVGALESDLEEAVSRIVTVDRHLAATYQALQNVLRSRANAADGGERVAEQVRALGDRLAERMELLRADALSAQAPVMARIEGLGDRLAALEVELTRERPQGVPEELSRRLGALEVALATTSDRLGGLESRAAASLSHAEFGREALAEIRGAVGPQEQTLGEVHSAVGSLREEVAAALEMLRGEVDAALAALRGEVAEAVGGRGAPEARGQQPEGVGAPEEPPAMAEEPPVAPEEPPATDEAPGGAREERARADEGGEELFAVAPAEAEVTEPAFPEPSSAAPVHGGVAVPDATDEEPPALHTEETNDEGGAPQPGAEQGEQAVEQPVAADDTPDAHEAEPYRAEPPPPPEDRFSSPAPPFWRSPPDERPF